MYIWGYYKTAFPGSYKARNIAGDFVRVIDELPPNPHPEEVIEKMKAFRKKKRRAAARKFLKQREKPTSEPLIAEIVDDMERGWIQAQASKKLKQRIDRPTSAPMDDALRREISLTIIDEDIEQELVEELMAMRSRGPGGVYDPQVVEETVAGGENVVEILGDAERASLIREAAANYLKGKEQKVFVMRLMEDKSFIEIGKEIGLTKNRAHQIYQKAVERVQTRINRELRSADN